MLVMPRTHIAVGKSRFVLKLSSPVSAISAARVHAEALAPFPRSGSSFLMRFIAISALLRPPHAGAHLRYRNITGFASYRIKCEMLRRQTIAAMPATDERYKRLRSEMRTKNNKCDFAFA